MKKSVSESNKLKKENGQSLSNTTIKKLSKFERNSHNQRLVYAFFDTQSDAVVGKKTFKSERHKKLYSKVKRQVALDLPEVFQDLFKGKPENISKVRKYIQDHKEKKAFLNIRTHNPDGVTLLGCLIDSGHKDLVQDLLIAGVDLDAFFIPPMEMDAKDESSSSKQFFTALDYAMVKNNGKLLGLLLPFYLSDHSCHKIVEESFYKAVRVDTKSSVECFLMAFQTPLPSEQRKNRMSVYADKFVNLFTLAENINVWNIFKPGINENIYQTQLKNITGKKPLLYQLIRERISCCLAGDEGCSDILSIINGLSESLTELVDIIVSDIKRLGTKGINFLENVLVTSVRQNLPNVLVYLLKHQINADAPSVMGNTEAINNFGTKVLIQFHITPLTLACYEGYVTCAKLLLIAGADPGAVLITKKISRGIGKKFSDKNNEIKVGEIEVDSKPFDAETDADFSKVAAELDQYWAAERNNKFEENINIESTRDFTNGINPLIAAVESGSLNVVEVLLPYVAANQIDINTCDASGMTALMYAAKQNNVGHVKILLSHDADIEARDFWGNPVISFTTDTRIADLMRIASQQETQSEQNNSNLDTDTDTDTEGVTDTDIKSACEHWPEIIVKGTQEEITVKYHKPSSRLFINDIQFLRKVCSIQVEDQDNVDLHYVIRNALLNRFALMMRKIVTLGPKSQFFPQKLAMVISSAILHNDDVAVFKSHQSLQRNQGLTRKVKCMIATVCDYLEANRDALKNDDSFKKGVNFYLKNKAPLLKQLLLHRHHTPSDAACMRQFTIARKELQSYQRIKNNSTFARLNISEADSDEIFAAAWRYTGSHLHIYLPNSWFLGLSDDLPDIELAKSIGAQEDRHPDVWKQDEVFIKYIATSISFFRQKTLSSEHPEHQDWKYPLEVFHV